MTDRELLELAAKAAGIVIHHWSDGRLPYECPVLNDGINEYIRVFDPLTDDGDALRLAVKLHINIEIWNVDALIRANVYLKGRGHGDFEERYTTDPQAATRRAIVRAAAEIGRGTHD